MAAPGSGDDDPERESRAYNENIYLMVGMPYFLLGLFGFLVYRGFKKLQQVDGFREAAPGEPVREGGAGVPAVSQPSGP